MNNFLNKIFCCCSGIFVFLHDIDASNCEQSLMKSNEKQEEVLQGEVLKETMQSINMSLSPIIKEDASRIFNIYNCFIEYINECCRFPIFFKIPEENFPKVLSYLSPNRKSIILMDNLLRVQDFFEKVYGNICEISQKLQDVLSAEFFQLNSQPVIYFPITIVKSVKFIDNQLPSISENNSSRFTITRTKLDNFSQLSTISEDPEPNLVSPKAINFITKVEQIDFSYGLVKFRKITEDIASSESFFSIMDSLNKWLLKFSASISSVKKGIRSLYFSLSTFDNLKAESELVRLLFASIYEISNLLSDVFSILNIIYKIPSNLIAIHEQLRFENLMRSNFMEKIFGRSFEKNTIIIPDITPVLAYIKKGLGLENDDQAMELFSYVANLQFLIHPISNYRNNESIEKLIKIYG